MSTNDPVEQPLNADAGLPAHVYKAAVEAMGRSRTAPEGIGEVEALRAWVRGQSDEDLDRRQGISADAVAHLRRWAGQEGAP